VLDRSARPWDSIGVVPIEDLPAELRQLAARLTATSSEGDASGIADPAQRLIDACQRIGDSWSGSALGYHSRVYYHNFVAPPSQAHFSVEWGLDQMFSNTTFGDWVLYTHEDVVTAIEAASGNLDTTALLAYSECARVVFDENRAEALSILTTALRSNEDILIRQSLDEINSMNPLSQRDASRLLLGPVEARSRDRRALDEGFVSPPHFTYLGGVIHLKDPGVRCGDLARVANRVADHIARIAAHSDTTLRHIAEIDLIAEPEAEVRTKRIFIGHGRSPLWLVLKDHLTNHFKLEVEDFNRTSAAGIPTTAHLRKKIDSCEMAFVVMTAEDEQADGSLHARENVVHEVGLSQGCLGFERAIVVLEDGCSEFSNIAGLGQIRFYTNDVRSCFDEVRLVLEREGVIPAS
jgi:hypothetical protein